jgi:hypothetical protein
MYIVVVVYNNNNIYECRCDERQQSKNQGITLIAEALFFLKELF